MAAKMALHLKLDFYLDFCHGTLQPPIYTHKRAGKTETND